MAKKSFADILAMQEAGQKRKVEAKLPSWAEAEGLVFPTSLCLEQCSSEATARYKAGIVRELGVRTVADLTGGLGVDCFAFSEVAGTVYHNEMDPVLSDAVKSNFAILGKPEIICSCMEASAALKSLPDGIDMIYMDPARRSGTGKKVFLLEDCSPNVLMMLPDIMAKAPLLMLKLSPMADISLIAKRLGPMLKEVRVAGTSGEVKELLCLLERGHNGGYDIIATDLKDEMRSTSDEITELKASFADPLPGMILFEPSPVLMKAGLAAKLGLPRLAASTHLYLAQEARSFGKNWMIREALPFGKAAMKELGKRFPQCEVTARNLPLTSEELKKKMGSASGGRTHIFGASGTKDRYLMVCEHILL